MTKRQKWRREEDKALREIVGQEEGELDWKIIAIKMSERGYDKAARQIKERWTNHLDPKLETESLRTEDHKNLIDLHESLGNCWKEIAKHFPGRSDNGIKNHFFAMIRKALRKARRAQGQLLNTAKVNMIKPKILANFLTQEIKMPTHLHAGDSRFPWTLQNPVKIREFITFFVVNKFEDFEYSLSERLILMISFILDRLTEMNNNYCSENKIFARRRKRVVESSVSESVKLCESFEVEQKPVVAAGNNKARSICASRDFDCESAGTRAEAKKRKTNIQMLLLKRSLSSMGLQENFSSSSRRCALEDRMPGLYDEEYRRTASGDSDDSFNKFEEEPRKKYSNVFDDQNCVILRSGALSHQSSDDSFSSFVSCGVPLRSR